MKKLNMSKLLKSALSLTLVLAMLAGCGLMFAGCNETGETPKYGDKLITLSTCEYTLENGRLVVVAYRIF